MSPGFVLDTGALVALERQSSQRRFSALLEALGEHGRLVLSAGALAEVWRGSSRQARLALLLRRRTTEVEEITVPVAKAIGAFLGHHPDGDDIVDAHVVMLARHHRLPVVTSDAGDLLALDPALPHVRI
ncbi:MAG: PIN domain-containing protein [Egibacteraceae bacterium]